MQNALLPPLLLQLLFPPLPSLKADSTLDLAVKMGLISVTAKGNGGHNGPCVTLRLANLSNRALHTTIPPGWLLQNSDTEAQDLMVVDRVPVELAPHAERTVVCQAYCVESADRAPAEGVPFLSLGMAPMAWVKLAEHLQQNKVEGSNAQAAVWAVANDHDIAAIDPAASILRKFVADLTGRELPWYDKAYAPPSLPGQVFSDVATTIHGSVEFVLNTHGAVSILIHNVHGTLVRTMGKDRHLGPGSYGMEVDLTVQGWPKGTYTIQFYLDDSRILKRLEFVV